MVIQFLLIIISEKVNKIDILRFELVLKIMYINNAKQVFYLII